jgi:DNA-binding PadR family transcriptional regulator
LASIKRPANRKIYSVTDTGQIELRRWLGKFQPLTVRREPFLIQLFFGAGLSNKELIILVEKQLEAHKERLKAYEQLSLLLPDLEDKKAQRNQVLHRLTLEGGFRTEKATIQWLEQCLKLLKNLQEE